MNLGTLKIEVESSRLEGIVSISGAKNSALKLLTASLLTDEEVILHNFPAKLIDTQIMIKMLEHLGKKIEIYPGYVKIKAGCIVKSEIEWEEESVRTTLLALGALLTRKRYAKVPSPGGCKIGERKYDLHIMLLEKMGAKIHEKDGYLIGEAPDGLNGTIIELPIRSTGATENAIIAGVLAKGKTIVYGPHIRPEVLDLIAFLKSMGARIELRGQESVVIEGTSYLSGASHSIIPDNVEALTFLVATLITKGEVEILNFPYRDLEVPLIYLRESGGKFFKGENSLIVKGIECYPVEIATGPFPGINSDMQPLFAVFATQAKGKSKIVDLRFPGRYGYVDELKKMGGVFNINGDMLIIEGPCALKGMVVRALDLRCGAALVLAGLVAENKTTILDAWQIMRGYEEIDKKFRGLGAKVFFSN